MRKDKLRARKADKALEILKALGIEVTKEELIGKATDIDSTPSNRMRQGEAAILFLREPTKFETKKCALEECDAWFAADYRSVAYCSNAHRDKAFFILTGMKVDWTAKTDIERWGGDPPLVIDPVTLQYLAQHVERINLELGLKEILATPPLEPHTDPLSEEQQPSHAAQSSEVSLSDSDLSPHTISPESLFDVDIPSWLLG